MNTASGYHVFKWSSLVLVVLVLAFQAVLVFGVFLDVLDVRKLSGGGRAQSELVLLPLVLFGGAGAALSLLLLIINAAVDVIRKRRETDQWQRDPWLYSFMVAALLTPVVMPWLLLSFLYAGWN